MAPKPPQLFHPKKKKPAQAKSSAASTPNSNDSVSPTKPPVKRRPQQPPPKADEDPDFKPPQGPFQEFKIMSSSRNGWKYDGMKFDSRKPVDVFTWQGPVKLNRKDLRRDDPIPVQKAVGPMLGPDGKPVIGVDGKMVMMDANGRPIHNLEPAKEKEKPKGFGGKKKFQKKTRQVFVVPEEQRMLRREERFPWVMEDSAGREVWQGQLDDINKAQTHAFFMPAANDIFKFVPSHRWYRFQKKVNHGLPTDLAEVENAYNLSQKRDPQAWLAQRTGRTVSTATSSTFKAEEEGRTVAGGSGSLAQSSGQSLGPGGRRLKTVDKGGDLFGDDEDEGEEAARKRRQKEFGAEGDIDEAEYEEEFADDEEMPNLDQDDEEAKDAEERLKREYKTANKQGDEAEEEDDDGHMKSKQERAMQKLIRKREGNDAYDSDDDRNPYASSEESEEEEPPIPTGPTIQEQHQQQLASRSATPKNAGGQPQPQKTQVNGHTAPVSRATSPSLGGHSVVAKRATSPKAPIPKVVTNGSRPGSPLAVPATTPGLQSPTNKRKAVDEGSPSPTSPNGSGPSSNKKRKSAPIGELDESMLVEWLRNTSNATTKDCIARFKPYIQSSPDGKTRLTELVKKVARVQDGLLVLKAPSAAPSRATSPSG